MSETNEPEILFESIVHLIHNHFFLLMQVKDTAIFEPLTMNAESELKKARQIS